MVKDEEIWMDMKWTLIHTAILKKVAYLEKYHLLSLRMPKTKHKKIIELEKYKHKSKTM